MLCRRITRSTRLRLTLWPAARSSAWIRGPHIGPGARHEPAGYPRFHRLTPLYLVSAFLEHLEDKRKNAAVTRNVRLAAIKSFFRFL